MKKVIFVIMLLSITFILYPETGYGKDYYFKSKTSTAGLGGQQARESTTEIWVSNDKLKSIDGASNQTFLIRLDEGKVYNINHTSKTYTVIPLESFKKFAQMGMGMSDGGELLENYRMLGGVVETPGGPWFAKLVGPEKTVAHWENSFYDFMKSFRPEGH